MLGNALLPYVAIYNIEDFSLTSYNNTLFFGTLPEQQMSAKMGDEIFIFGGVLNGITRDILVYDTTNDSLKILNKLLQIPL